MQPKFVRRSLRVVVLTACLALLAPMPARAADAVTEWTFLADRLGRNAANWHTLAIMHQAMHDAMNAALPTYARWFPPLPNEPLAEGALPQAAMIAAATQVLLSLHWDQRDETMRVYESALTRMQDGPERQAGITLGAAVGLAAVTRRENDGYTVILPFPTATGPGQWRHTPAEFASSNTTRTRPFLSASRDDPAAPPPPAPGSALLIRDAEETRRMGARDDSPRTQAQTDAAFFWAYQSSQRGFPHLAVTLLDRHPRPGGMIEHARIMSQLTSAMADSAILAWAGKERFSYWRPITVLQGGFGVAADPDWMPLIETPPHPDYPSGHATDCFTGAGFLAAVFGRQASPVTYVAQTGVPQAEKAAIGMGQHMQIGHTIPNERRFPTLAAAAQECADSRIWAGAHFRTANNEANRIADGIVGRALAAVPPLR